MFFRLEFDIIDCVTSQTRLFALLGLLVSDSLLFDSYIKLGCDAKVV